MSSKHLPPRPNAEHLRNQAKRLLKAFRARDSEALERFGAVLPKYADSQDADTSLADAQSVIAREFGFDSWRALMDHLAARGEMKGDADAVTVERFIDRAVATNCNAEDHLHATEFREACDMLATHPKLSSETFETSIVTGNVQAVARAIGNDASVATTPCGVRRWSPILYASYSRLHRHTDRGYPRRLTEIARLLLDNGADPNAWFPLDEGAGTALFGAIGVSLNPDLARLLLERGANLDDDEAYYHAGEAPIACARALADHGLDREHLTTTLFRKLDFEEQDAVRALLEMGADPNDARRFGKTALQHAIIRYRSIEIIDTLLDANADPNLEVDEQSAFVLAAVRGRKDVMDSIQTRGFAGTPTTKEQFVSACAMADEPGARKILETAPNVLGELTESDQACLTYAAVQGHADAVHLMLDLGFDIEARGQYRFTALHQAGWYGHLDIVKLLIDRGADLTATHDFNGTPLSSSIYGWVTGKGNDREAEGIIDALIEAGADYGRIQLPTGHEVVDRVLGERKAISD